MQVEHELTIPADIDDVWNMTLDVERWPELTPTMTSVERLDAEPFGLGSQARILQPKQRPRVWTVTRFEPPADRRATFAWSAKLGPVTMTGGHHLEVVEGGTRNRLTLELTGFGSRLLGALAGKQLLATITTENEGFCAASGHRSVSAGGTEPREGVELQAGGSTT